MVPLQHNTAAAVDEQAVWAAAQALLLGVLAMTVGLGPLGWLAGSVYAVATWALLGAALLRSGTVLGPADRVTLARGVLVGGVTAVVVDRVGTNMPTAVVVAVAAIALALDFVDGRVARRTGTCSAVGGWFDMELDAFLILVLSVLVAFGLGPWVLVIGVMRYVFVAAAWVAPWLVGELPPSYARKTVAAVQGIVLVAVASGVVPFAGVLVGLALASLVWSFGRDVFWLWRNRVKVEVDV